MQESISKEKIVFFDGVCGLCNRFIDFLLRYDSRKKLYFAPLQGHTAAKKLTLESEELESIVFFNGEQFYLRSRAVLEILWELNGIWRVFYIFIMIPSFIRDAIYDFVARNRYKIFGQRDSCRLPNQEEIAHFLP